MGLNQEEVLVVTPSTLSRQGGGGERGGGGEGKGEGERGEGERVFVLSFFS